LDILLEYPFLTTIRYFAISWLKKFLDSKKSQQLLRRRPDVDYIILPQISAAQTSIMPAQSSPSYPSCL